LAESVDVESEKGVLSVVPIPMLSQTIEYAPDVPKFVMFSALQ